MLGTAIVPECNTVVGPPEPHAPMRPCEVIVQKLQHPTTFGSRHFINVAGKFAVDEKQLAAALRMANDDRMDGGRIDVFIPVKSTRTLMRGSLTLEIGLH